jgi:hypothetical protein
MRVGLEKDDKNSFTYGLNPLQGASRWTLIVYLVVSRLKAAISNYVAKIILRRILGRYAIRTLIDMVGIPVYGFWNAYASYTVIQETKVRIMAPNAIKQICQYLHNRYMNSPEFISYIYDTLQYISMSKRKYHHNHFLLAKNILKTFEIPVKEQHNLRENFLVDIKNLTPEIKTGVVQLLILGFIIDGDISTKESLFISNLHKEDVINCDVQQVKEWSKSFINGKGIDSLIEYNLL